MEILENRGNPDAFEPAPTLETAKPAEKPAAPVAKTPVSGPAVYTVELEGKSFVVKVTDGEKSVRLPCSTNSATTCPGIYEWNTCQRPNVWQYLESGSKEGQKVAEGDVLLILEAMKMETEIRASQAGTVQSIHVKAGDTVAVGDTLMTLS